MKAISLWEPWASLIRVGAKKQETRSWYTAYRGPLLICAAKGGLGNGELEMLINQPVFQKALQPLCPGKIITTDMFFHGKAVAIVELTNCKTTDIMSNQDVGADAPFGNFAPGRFAWKLENLQAIEPFPIKGKQGLFNYEP